MTSLSLGPHYRSRLGTVLHFAHCVSATYPSAKQVLYPTLLTDRDWYSWKRPFGRFHCTINRPTPPTGATSLPRSGLPPSNRSDGNTTTGPMTLHPDFREFIQLLNDHSVRYLVVGGYAVALHGHPRYTKDLDVWAEADSENIERLLSALKAFGFGSLDLNVDDFLEPDTVVQLGRPAQRIDLLTELDGVAFDNSYATRI